MKTNEPIHQSECSIHMSTHKPRHNQCSKTDKQVLDLIWKHDLDPSAENASLLLIAANQRGIKTSSITEQQINELCVLCGFRARNEGGA